MDLTQEIERKARQFSLVGDPTRLRILRLLASKKQVNVSDIAAEVGMGIACVSHHLQLLKDNGLLSSRRQGNSIYYQLAEDSFIRKLVPLIK